MIDRYCRSLWSSLFFVLAVKDDAGSGSLRGSISRNIISRERRHTFGPRRPRTLSASVIDLIHECYWHEYTSLLPCALIVHICVFVLMRTCVHVCAHLFCGDAGEALGRGRGGGRREIELDRVSQHERE